MSLAEKVYRAVTLARWDNPQRILIDRFVGRVAQEVPQYARILDAGAGEGVYAPAFAHCTYVACDRAIGDTAWDYSGLDVVADLAALPFRKATFDAILCTQTLEHIGEPAAVLRNMAELLKSGGRLYMSAPFLGDPIHQEPYDFFRYTHYGLQHLVETTGLTLVSISPIGGVFFLGCCSLWWCAIIYKVLWRNSAANAALLTRVARRVIGAGVLFGARLGTMLLMVLRQTETASKHFTYGYIVVAEKP